MEVAALVRVLCFCVSFFFVLFACVARGMLPFLGAAWYEYDIVICQYITVPVLKPGRSSWPVNRSVSRPESDGILLAVWYAVCPSVAFPQGGTVPLECIGKWGSSFLWSIGAYFVCPGWEVWYQKTGIKEVCYSGMW